MLEGQDATVVGGGIAGLATARALALRGARVTVLEQAPEIAEVGAGLQISPNGLAVLDGLGLGGAVRDRSVSAQAVVLRDYRSGAGIIRLDLAAVRQRGYQLVHRADLIDILLQGANEAGASVRTGAELAEIADGSDRAGLTLATGERLVTPLAVGADGLHSHIRARLNRDADPFFTGQLAWRALVPAEGAERSASGEVEVWLGPGRHLVRYPLRGGELTNIVAVEERGKWIAEGWHHLGDPAGLRQAFSGFAGEVCDLLARVEKVHVWGLFRHPVATNWHGARTVLVGDAAHPTLPFLAQGANMALEDAWTLADCLERAPVAQALAAYQGRREQRVRRIIAAANANARNYHLRNPLVRGAAHGLLRLAGALAPGQVLGRYGWIHDHDVTAEGPSGRAG